MTREPAHAMPLCLSADVSAGTEPREFTLLTVALLAVAVVWSIATTRYRYDVSDMTWQLPIIMHIMNPELFNRDPLITEVAVRYLSLSFYVLAGLAHFASLPAVCAVVFVVARTATIATFYHLAYVCTSNRLTALLATFLLVAVGGYTYLAFTPLLNFYPVPRSIALPFLLMAMASMIRENHLWSAVWICLTLFFHPVTGVNLAGVYFVYNLAAFRQLQWRAFLSACLLIACMIGGFAVYSAHSGATDRFLDSQWRNIIHVYAPGPYGFLFPYTWYQTSFWIPLIEGTAMVAIIRPPSFVFPFFRFLVAGLAAILVHCITVEWLGIVPFVQALPARATMTCIVTAIVAQGVCVGFLWNRGTLLTRGVACLLFFDLFFGLSFPMVSAAIAILVAYLQRQKAVDECRSASTWPGAFLPAFAALAILAIVSGVFGSLRGRLAAIRDGTSAEFQGFDDLADLGRRRYPDALDQVKVQVWIRDHSRIDDMIFPPVGMHSEASVTSFGRVGKWNSGWQKYYESKGWEIFSERACVFHGALHCNVYLSRSFALRCQSFDERLPHGPDVSWSDMIRFARGEGADWIVIDDRDYPRREGDPEPIFSAGAYHVFRAPG
jgi:hypothetical protein